MSWLRRLAPDESLHGQILGVAAVVAVVVAMAKLTARLASGRGARFRHDVALCGLCLVLLSPAIVGLVGLSGITLIALPRIASTRATVAEEPEGKLAPRGDDARAPRITRASELAASIDHAAPPAAVVPTATAETFPATAEPMVDSSPEPEAPAPITLQTSPPARFDAKLAQGGLVAIWLVGVVFLAVRLAHGMRAMATLRRHARPIDGPIVAGVLDEVRHILGTASLPPIVVGSAHRGPLAGGISRPVVVLPEGLVESLDPSGLRDVLVHECAHALRGDPLVGLLQRAAAMMFWPHPLVHHLNRALSRAREEVCDDYVLRSRDACGYARTLLFLAERAGTRRRGVAVGLFDTRWPLEARVARILDQGRKPMTRVNRWATAVVALMMLTAGLATAAIRPAREQPRKLAAPVAAGLVAEDATTVITGVVVDEAGKPVAGAAVNCTWFRAASKDAITGDDGRFTLSLGGPLRSAELLRATKGGGASQGVAEYGEPIFAKPEPMRIVLKPAKALLVKVVNEAGNPVADAAVEVQSWGNGPLAIARSDAKGDARFQIAADAQVGIVHGGKDGVGFDYFENYREWPTSTGRVEPDPLPAEVKLILDGARTITVNTVGTDGKPVPNVSFRTSSVNKPGKMSSANLSGSDTTRLTTDAEGRGRIAWMPRTLTSKVDLAVYPWRFSQVAYAFIPHASDASLTITVLRNARVAGKVLGPDGSPVEGLLLHAAGFGKSPSGGHHFARTAKDGSFAFSLQPEQTYMIATLDRDRAAAPLTGLVVREGQDREGVDLKLVESSHVRGTVTKPDGSPAAESWISLAILGGEIPEEFRSPYRGDLRQRAYAGFKTDREGRYQIAVATGEYELRSANIRDPRTIRISAKPSEVKHNFILEPIAAQKKVSGTVVDATGAANRPVGGAMVRVVPIGNRGGDIETLADAGGRFVVESSGTEGHIYARDRAGTIAGWVYLPPTGGEISIALAPAATATGRVVDELGKPLIGKQVFLQGATTADEKTSARFHESVMTDAAGRFAFSGLVPGMKCDVGVMDDDLFGAGGRSSVETFQVRGHEPIALKDMVVEGVQKPRAALPREVKVPEQPKAGDLKAFSPVPYLITRAEVQRLIKAIGREPATPELVDEVLTMVRPQFHWVTDLERIKQLGADAGFVARVDRASKEVAGKPADTRTIVSLATSYHVGRDDANLVDFMRTLAKPVVPRSVRGTVIDAATKKPIVGAVVFRPSELARTGADGGFSLVKQSGRRVWVEADGYALRELVLPAEVGGEPVEIALVDEAPIRGTVVYGSEPVPGAIVWAMVKHSVFANDGPAKKNDSYGFPITARTDAAGQFVFRGMPPGAELAGYEVRHARFMIKEGARPALRSGPASAVQVEPGCRVAGRVVEDTGRGVAGASVQIHKPGSAGTEQETYTDAKGYYLFGNVAPGRRDVIVEPERHAARRLAIVASRDGAAETQVVVEPGAFLFGKVVDAEGKPVANAAVGWLVPLDRDRGADEGFSLNRMTNSAADGTFRIGPVPPIEVRVTAVTESPRLLGKVDAKVAEAGLVITVKPDER